MKKSIRVITFCFTLMLSTGRLCAQTYTPVPYNFGGAFEVTDDSVPFGQTATDITMDCLAANGYGQWTASYKTQNAFDSGSPGLFLLANALRMPTYASATGIVSFRPFTYTDSSGYPVDSATTHRSVVKCAANLKGRVRYVWPFPDHTGFYVEGFNECPPNDSAGLTGINLQFASYPYNTSYGDSNAYLGKDVIKTTIAVPFNLIPMVGHTIVTAAHESDPRDWFDIAMDTTFLYVVWEEYDSTGHYNIWECNQTLSTNAWSGPIEVAAGARRATVNADLRRCLNPSFPGSPCFDVAYITGTLGTDHLTWYNYEAARFPHPADTLEMNKTCQDTVSGTWTYKKILHARMLDATWEGIASSDTTPRAIYAIVTDQGQNNHLVMFKIKGGAQDANAYYCDGDSIVNHAAGVNDGKFPIIDKPIRAFVNPYDGQKNDNFDEYHCMYQLQRSYPGGSHRPLMMIHGAMVSNTLGPRVCLNYAGTNTTPGTIIDRPDTLHRFYSDPGLNLDGGDTDNYVGAVNQMGIHCHWRNGTQHYYLRDRRMFDEDIEENTLATEDVYIDNGTSHGGNYTPTVQPGKTMTLWSDYRITSGDTGICTLQFPDTGVNHASAALVVGTGSDTGSNFVNVQAADILGDTTSQLVHVMPNATLQDYAVDTFNVGLKLQGTGVTMTGGTYSYPSSIANPANLNIHGGSTFYVASFASDSSIVTLGYDGSNRAAFYLPGSVSITNSILTNLAPPFIGYTWNSFDVLGNANWQNPDTVFITNSLVNGGDFIVGDNGPPYPSLPVVITGGKFNNAPISASAGPNSFTIQNVLFKDDSTYFYPFIGYGAAIFLENINSVGTQYETYNPITISGCDFAALPDSTDAIRALGYATDSNVMQNLNITGNTFNNADYPTLLPHAAIELQQSEGLITDNIIENHFQYGIIVSGANSYNSHLTKSTICSNSITAGNIAGISTDNTTGYAELNEVETIVGVGHISGVNDAGKIIYSNYSADGGGIYVSSSSAAPDLTGIHSTTPDSIDVAAFDTIELDGGVAQISLVAGSHIRLGNDPEPWYWTNWSQNNIITGYSDDYCPCLGGGVGISYVPLIVEDTGHSISPLGNISHNFFDVIGLSVVLPENQSDTTGCNDTLTRGTPASWIAGESTPYAALGFCYSADSNFTTWQNRPAGAVDCGLTLPTGDKTKKNGVKTLSVPPTDTSCREKFAIGNSDILDGNGSSDLVVGDSVLEEFIETCYDTIDAWEAFVDLSGGIANPSPTSFANYREWLKSVLWLNTIDPLYYCICAQSIYESYEPIDAGRNINATLSVIRYLDSSGRCPQNSADNNTAYQQELATRHMVWLDTVNSLHNGDTTDFPEDTTIPTIDELGLSILRGLPAGVQNDTTATTGITNLTASENPFDKQTTIYFTTGEYAYISFQVFDVLGRIVQGDYKGSVQGPGEYQFTVDGTNLPTGSYYARITTPTGITRTIKLVKE